MAEQSKITAEPEDEIEDSAAPLIEHLAELRTRLIRSVLAFLAGMILCFAFAETILDFLLVPIERTLRDLGDPDPQMIFTSPQEYFFTLIRISMVMGLAVSFPVIAHQMWRFVAPGLYRSEKSAFLPFIIASPLLFLLGASFAHFVVTPLAMAFFLGFADAASLFSDLVVGDAAEVLTPDGAPAAMVPLAVPTDGTGGVDIKFLGKVNESFDILLKFIMAFGLCFQLPVLLTLMGKAGLVSAAGLRSTRKYAVVGILVLAAIVTPPDVITQIILFSVVYALYEVSIQLVRWVEHAREERLRAEGYYDDEEPESTSVGKAGE
ncbi:MAG: twin-arginine translocase subunit TatC [Pseudomonadota bacterium]